MSTVWSSAIAGDEISVDLHLTKEAAFDSIRDAWNVPDAVPDEKMWGFLKREYDVEFSIQEHPLPRQPEVTHTQDSRSIWEDVVRKTGKCSDKMCDCRKLEVSK